MPRKPVLSVVSIAICALFGVLLLHPSVPGMLPAVVPKPNLTLVKLAENAAHLSVFLIATELALISVDATTAARRRLILAILALTAIGTELAQHFFPPRGVDWLDAACNLVGVALAGVAYERLFAATANSH